jgi:ADP-heptose:LPS heptosyltransferase
VILTLPMAHVLREQIPGVSVTMLLRRYTTEIVDAHGDIAQVITCDDEHGTIPFFSLVRRLRAEKFDAVIHTHPRPRLALITWIARIPVRVGTGYRFYSFLFNKKVFEHRKDARFHELEYNLHLLRALGCDFDEKAVKPVLPVFPEAEASVSKLLAKYGVTKEEKVVILHPGSGGSARDWCAANFGEVGKRLVELPGVRVVVTWVPGEKKVIDEVMQMTGGKAIPLVGVLTLREYAALAHRAAVFVGNSTGTLHIAAAVGTAVVGLYPQVTALNATRWGPYTDKKIVFTPLGKPVDCTACRQTGDGACGCMDSIPVENVYNAVVTFLNQVNA